MGRRRRPGEGYRRRVLRLPYGTPAYSGTADPACHALGPRPAEPSAAADYGQARDAGPELSGQLAL
jgi:hypothetical protein